MAQEPRVADPAVPPAARVQVLTPLAGGAIAVAQVAGPQALSLAEAVFHPRSGRSLATYLPGQLAYGDLLDDAGAAFDDGLAVHGAVDGQPWVQFSVHGGVRIVQRLVRRLVDLGAELERSPDAGGGPAGAPRQQRSAAAPDPQPRAAVPQVPPVRTPAAQADNPAIRLVTGLPVAPGAVPPAGDRSFDWLCPVDRWVQQCLVMAATPRVVEWLVHQGGLWHEVLADWRRRIEAGDADSVRRDAQGLMQKEDAGYAWRGRTLAILGLPNAGKSTIANRLAGRGMSLVADAPGTTRDWVGEPVAIQGWPVFLVDTAGLRPAAEPVEAEGVERALQQARQADVRLLVIDSSCPPSGSEDWLVRQVGLQSVDTVAYTKCDLPGGRGPEEGLSVPAGVRAVRVSGLTGAGWTDLEGRLLEGFGFPTSQESAPLVFCLQVRSCVASLASAPGTREMAEALAGLEVVESCPTHKTTR